MNDVFKHGSYLRTSRAYPGDNLQQLAVELNRTYIDIATAVNRRMIGFFTTNRSTVTGESWYFNQAKRQQSLRQIYTWEDNGTNTIAITHGLNFLSLTNFSRIWGTFFDGTNWQTLPYVDITAADNQINVMVNEMEIVITKGAGTPPTCANGLVIVEYIANP